MAGDGNPRRRGVFRGRGHRGNAEPEWSTRRDCGNGAGSFPSQLVVAEKEDGELGLVWFPGDHIKDVSFDGSPYFDGDSSERVGRGLVFSDEGVLALGIAGGSEDAAVLLDVDEASNAADVGIDFALHNEVPIYWGQTLDMDAVISNFDSTAIESYDLTIEFSPSISDPEVACEGSQYDEASSRLEIDCAGEAPMLLPNGTDIGFSIRTPVSATDGKLTLEAVLETDHEDGRIGLDLTTWSFDLIATPDGTDLAVSVDDSVAATSMRVDNLGPRPATGVVLQATLDAGAGHFTVPDDPRCTREGEQLLLVCHVGDLDVGDAVEIAFPALSDGTGTVTVTSDQPDFAPDNDETRFTLLIEVDEDAVPPGCGDCRVGSSRGPFGGWLLLLLALPTLNRRRRCGPAWRTR